MKKLFSVVMAVALLASTSVANADFFTGNGPGGAIPDGSGTGVSGGPLISQIVVPGTVAGPITDVSVSFTGLAHTWVGDVTMILHHVPTGTMMDLMSRPGRGSGSTFGFAGDFLAGNSYSFSDTGNPLFAADPGASIASQDIQPSSNPNPPGSNANPYVYTPNSFFASFGGLAAPGTWELIVEDWAGGDTGSIGGWTLNVTTIPEPSSLTLLGLAALGLVGARRRRNG